MALVISNELRVISSFWRAQSWLVTTLTETHPTWKIFRFDVIVANIKGSSGEPITASVRIPPVRIIGCRVIDGIVPNVQLGSPGPTSRWHVIVRFRVAWLGAGTAVVFTWWSFGLVHTIIGIWRFEADFYVHIALVGRLATCGWLQNILWTVTKKPYFNAYHVADDRFNINYQSIVWFAVIDFFCSVWCNDQCVMDF